MNEKDSTTGSTALQVRESHDIEEVGLPVEKVIQQVRRVQEVMKSVMREGEHYGTIPGTEGKCPECNGTGKKENGESCELCSGTGKKKKPTLLKPGAEKLGFTFQLAPRFEINRTEMEDGHREYEIICRLYTIGSGRLVGEGVGSCSTMESKYRYRSENTNQLVPKEYWEQGRDPALIGGSAYSTRKMDGKWYIFHKVDHDNPADYYNTCLKMGKKRAHVDAILTATAASDIFTQDVEDLPPPPETITGEVVHTAAAAPATTVRAPQQKPAQAQPAAKPNGNHEPPPVGTLRYIRKVETAEGENQKTGKEWIRYDVWFEDDANKYSTFSTSIGEEAEDAWNRGLGCVVDTKAVQSGKYTNYTIENLEVVEESNRQGAESEAQGATSPF